MTIEDPKDEGEGKKGSTGFEVQRVIAPNARVDALVSPDSEVIHLGKYVVTYGNGELFVNGGKVKMFPKVIPAFLYAAKKGFKVSQQELEEKFGKLEMGGKYSVLVNAVLGQFPELQIQEPKKEPKRVRNYTPSEVDGEKLLFATLVCSGEQVRVQFYKKIQRGRKTLWLMQINDGEMLSLRTNYEQQVDVMMHLVVSGYMERNMFDSKFSSQTQIYSKIKLLNELLLPYNLKIALNQDGNYEVTHEGKRVIVQWA